MTDTADHTDQPQELDTADEATPAETAEPEPEGETEDESPDVDTDEQVTNPQLKKARTEAARYRTQLRETEGERDRLTTQLETLQRRLVEQAMPPTAAIKPAALWAADPTARPADFLDDDGNINTEALSEAVSNAVKTLGIQRFTGTGDGGARRSDAPNGATAWADLLRNSAP